MKKNDMPPLQKLIACFFALIFIASFVFIGYRVYTKSAYEANEKEQAKLLAVSVISLFGEKTVQDPGIWSKFDANETELIIDHMKIKGNWVIKVNFAHIGNDIEILSSVSSGWNSRSPQSVEYRAKIYSDGRVTFEGSDTASTEVTLIKKGRERALGRIHSFRFPDELKKMPVAVYAEEYIMTDSEGKEFLILKEPAKADQASSQSE